MAEQPHGTRSRYISGCRCMVCRAANSRYETERAAARKAGDWNGYVSAAPAREWLKRLSRAGIGRHAACAASGVSDSILFAIINGTRLKIRARTERRILAIDESCRADHSIEPAAPTWKLLDELVADGYSKRWLARNLGKGNQIQFNRRRITAINALKVERLYRLIRAGKVSR